MSAGHRALPTPEISLRSRVCKCFLALHITPLSSPSSSNEKSPSGYHPPSPSPPSFLHQSIHSQVSSKGCLHFPSPTSSLSSLSRTLSSLVSVPRPPRMEGWILELLWLSATAPQPRCTPAPPVINPCQSWSLPASPDPPSELLLCWWSEQTPFSSHRPLPWVQQPDYQRVGLMTGLDGQLSSPQGSRPGRPEPS